MRVYTLEEARTLIPAIRPVLESVRSAYIRLRALQSAKAADARASSGDGHLLVDVYSATALPGESERLQATLAEGVDRLTTLGIELKDPARGLIDFYHQAPDGELVFLCYLLGEPDLAFWHTIDGGFAGRKPIA